MKVNTKQRKKATKGFEQIYGKDELANRMFHILTTGKQGIDALLQELGIMMAQAIMDMEREELSGPEYLPRQKGVYKVGIPTRFYLPRGSEGVCTTSQPQGPEGEIPLKSYEMLKEPERFSEELLNRMLRGVSARKYRETVLESARAFGVSPSSVSRHIVAVTSRNLTMFKEKDLADLNVFAVFIDTIHRGGDAFMVALGIDKEGIKHVLGFWQGATENHEICTELLADMERRHLVLSKSILWVTDGGKGIIKTLKDRFGKKLIHQRCTIHKDRNIQKHLAKKYRKEAHRRFTTALEQVNYTDAKEMLLDFEKWLRAINESAADSLMEAIEEILTLHRLKIPALLRKTLTSTNPIESMFSTVSRDCERNIKRYRTSAMAQRWLASVLIHCEKGFRRIKEYRDIPQVLANIEAAQNEDMLQAAA